MARGKSVAETVPSRGRHWWMLGGKFALAGALVWWLVRSGRLEWEMLAQARLGGAFLGLVACRIAVVTIPFLRWQLLVRALGLRLGVGEALRIGLVAHFFGILVPSWVGQDGVRLFYGSRENQGRVPELISSILVDRVIGLTTIVLLTLVWGGALWFTNPGSELARLVLGTGTLLLVGLAAGGLLLRWAPRGLARFARWHSAERVLESVARYRPRRRALLGAFALSALSQSVLVLATWLGFRTIGVSPQLLAVGAITQLVSLANSIPLTPMGLGVSDSVSEALFRLVGTSGGAEVSFIIRFAALLVSVACGMAFLLPGYRSGTRLSPVAKEEAACGSRI